MSADMRELESAEPVYMVEITLSGGAVLRLATRGLTYGSERYEDYLDGIRGLGGILERASAQGRDSGITLVFRNEPYKNWQHLVLASGEHPFEGSACVVREARIDSSGAITEPEEIFRGRLDAPESITSLGFVCEACSAEYGQDRKV